MGVIWTRKTRTRQPQGVPRASELGRRASLLLSNGLSAPVVKPAGVVSLSSVSGATLGPGGRAYLSSGTTPRQLTLRDSSGNVSSAAAVYVPNGASFTFFVHVDITAKNGANPGFVRSGVDNNENLFCILESGVWPWIRLGSGNDVLRPYGSASLPANFQGVIAYRVASSASASAAWGGKIQAHATHAVATPESYLTGFGLQYDQSESINGLYYSICWLPWAVSDAQLQAMTTAEGYYDALFSPQRTPVFYSISGSSSAVVASYRMRRPGLSRVWR